MHEKDEKRNIIFKQLSITITSSDDKDIMLHVPRQLAWAPISLLLYCILGWLNELNSWLFLTKAELIQVSLLNMVRTILKWLSKDVAPLPSEMKVGIPVSLVNMLVKMIVTPKVKMKKKNCYTLSCQFLTSV